MAIGDILRIGREAVARRAWPEAYEALAAADAAGALEPQDLELLAKTAWWTGRPGGSIEARERAYAAYVDRGDRRRAAFVALTLRREHSAKLAGSVAQGWMNRAEGLLAEEPEDAAHGYLAIAHGSVTWGRGELDQALAHFERAIEIGGRVGDVDLSAWATMYRGMVLIDLGRVEEGWMLMEGVSASAIGGELGGYTTGGVFCNVISTCRDLADYRRATEWAEAAKRWCERQSINGFPGVCRVHRAEVMRLVGSWTEADAELRTACDELFAFSPVHAGEAFHELGEVRLRMGDLPGAEAAFQQADEMGKDPQPGRSLLLLREGKPDAAAAAIARSLEDEWNRLLRARLLPIQAEIAYRRGDVATASAAADELEEIAANYATDALAAAAAWARGCVALAERDPAEASRRFRKARQLWRNVDAPFEATRTTVFLGEALAASGDLDGATIELEAARAAFARLGAGPDESGVLDRLATLRPMEAQAARRTFVFTDIVGSTALLEAIGDNAWNDLRRWHDEALRGCVTEHGGEEVDHAGDGFFVAFPEPRAAIMCAQQIQHRLSEHRRTHGFAPQVRIGVHATDAQQVDEGYAGIGVHTAARIGAVAVGGEIVASVATIDEVPGIETNERRSVELKGLADPVEIVTVPWT